MSRCQWAGCDRTDTTEADGWLHCKPHLYEHNLLMAEEREGRPRERNGKSAAVCGTTGGYRKHLRLKELTCSDCRRANALENNKTRAVA